jgi:RNA polymerase sigma-70 factor (ECF subfamily)
VIELERLHRVEWSRLLSALIRVLGDFDLAEDALQEAFAAAAAEWAGRPPRSPRGWLFATARHRGLDRLRARRTSAARLEALAASAQLEADVEDAAVPDERLRLLFTCCHPALSPEAQVALTLRTVCGLRTDEIARAFLVPAANMAQRLVRAKARIREAGIPYAVPEADELPERLAAVMSVVYLVFTEGHSATRGDALVRRELCDDAIDLARVLRRLLPRPEPEVDALLALLLLHHARRDARVDPTGALVLLERQDRARWDRAQIAEGVALVEEALRRGPGPPGPYALEAAIAAVHAEARTAAETDWAQIALLYRRLLAIHPSPVVALNHAVAVAMAEGPAAALPLVERLGDRLAANHLWHATRADLLRRVGRAAEAAAAYARAAELATNGAERRFLERARQDVQGGAPP